MQSVEKEWKHIMSQRPLIDVKSGIRRRSASADGNDRTQQFLAGSREGSGGRWILRREEAARRATMRLMQAAANNNIPVNGTTSVISANGTPRSSQDRLGAMLSNMDNISARSSSAINDPRFRSSAGTSSLENISYFLSASTPKGMASGDSIRLSTQDALERARRAEEALYQLLEEEEMDNAIAKETSRLLGEELENGGAGGANPRLVTPFGPPQRSSERPSNASMAASEGEEFTLRSLVVGAVVGGFLSLMNIYMGFKLTIWQPIGLPATIIGFALMRTSVAYLGGYFPSLFGMPFGYRENVVLQTAAVAASEMASASGICSTLFAATCRYQHFIYNTNNGNRDDDDSNVPFGECQTNSGLNSDGSKCECLAPFGFKQVVLYCYSCLALGIFYAVPLRRILLEKMDLPWPTPTATAVVIRAMHHTVDGVSNGMQQFMILCQGAAFPFFWGLWTFTYDNSSNWAVFGASAMAKWEWFGTIDFNYIGGSLLIKLKYSFSSLLGAIMMWGIFIPVLQNHAADAPKESDIHKFWFNDSITSAFDYGVYATVGMILADCIWNVGKMMLVLFAKTDASPIPSNDEGEGVPGGGDENQRLSHRSSGQRGSGGGRRPKGGYNNVSSDTPDVAIDGEGSSSGGGAPTAEPEFSDGPLLPPLTMSPLHHTDMDANNERNQAVYTAASEKAVAAAVAAGLRKDIGQKQQRTVSSVSEDSFQAAQPYVPPRRGTDSMSSLTTDQWQPSNSMGGEESEGCLTSCFKLNNMEAGDLDPKTNQDIPDYIWIGGFIVTSLMAIVFIPLIYEGDGIGHLMVLTTVFLAFITAPGIAYVQGATDQGMMFVVNKLVIIIIGIWSTHSLNNPSLVPALTCASVSYIMLTQTGDIMSDWRTAQLLGVSPRSMLKAQLFGALLGPLFSAFGFYVYMSLPSNERPPSNSYPAPVAKVYWAFGSLFASGDAIPQGVLLVMLVSAALSLTINIVEELVPPHIQDYIPSSSMIALGFYQSTGSSIAQAVGGCLRWWGSTYRKEWWDKNHVPLAAGVITGAGLGGVMVSFIQWGSVEPFVHIKFYAYDADKDDGQY